MQADSGPGWYGLPMLGRSIAVLIVCWLVSAGAQAREPFFLKCDVPSMLDVTTWSFRVDPPALLPDRFALTIGPIGPRISILGDIGKEGITPSNYDETTIEFQVTGKLEGYTNDVSFVFSINRITGSIRFKILEKLPQPSNAHGWSISKIIDERGGRCVKVERRF